MDRLLTQLYGLAVCFFVLVGIMIWCVHKMLQTIPGIFRALKEFNQARENLMETFRENTK